MSALDGVNLVLATSFAARARGLLGTRPDWGDATSVLALVPCNSVHTYFMCYAIDVAFCDARGMVVRSERNVRPWRVLSCRKAAFVLERPHANDAPWPSRTDKVPIKIHCA